MKVRTRIAPSPTGDPHIGTFYSAVLDYALTKKYRGQFVVRIEDTDRTRFVKGAEDKIYAALDWLGLKEDESPRKGGPFAPYRQSKRLAIYQKYVQKLIKTGAAYPCFCSSQRLESLRQEQRAQKLPPKYDRYCLKLSQTEIKDRLQNKEPYVVRLKVPGQGQTSLNDLLRGRIVFENRLIDDQVLLKSDGFPTYHLAVVVDDHLMQITHVIRGEEWISSAPKHILIYQALNWEVPQFLHHPLLRNPDKSKMSKRKNPTSVLWYREQGFLPQALVNYLTQLGWTHPQQKDIYSFEEFLEKFDPKDLKTSAPVFDLEKLKWVNAQYLKRIPAKKLAAAISRTSRYHPRPDQVEPIIPLLRDRLKTINEYDALAGFLHQRPLISPQGRKLPQLRLAYNRLLKETSWDAKAIEKAMRDVADENKIKARDLFMELRIVISGSRVSLPLFESMQQLGQKETLERIKLSLDPEQ